MNAVLTDLRADNNFAFGKLYQENFSKIRVFVRNHGGSSADAEDLFQDAMIVLLEKLRHDQFRLTASINTYVYAICKNLWFKKLRNQRAELPLAEIRTEEFLYTITLSIENERSYLERLKTYLMQITDHCHKLIHDMFFKEKAVEEIQQEYGYSTRHNAHNQKHKCVEQIRRVKQREEKSKKIGRVG